LNETAIAALATLTQILRFAMEVQILTLGVLVLKKNNSKKHDCVCRCWYGKCGFATHTFVAICRGIDMFNISTWVDDF